MKIPTPTELTQDAAARLRRLAESQQGWNLLAALYSEGAQMNDEVSAFAERGKDIVRESIRQTLRLALAGLEGDRKLFHRLIAKIDKIDQRERKMARLLQAALLRSGGGRKGVAA